MASGGLKRITALGLIVVAIGAGGYWLSRPEPTPPIVGVVRTTEVRIAPEVGGQLAAIKVHKGDTVRAGDVVAELSAIELTASVGQARAALAAATADRNNVYAGVRAEQVASLAAEIAKAKSRLEYAEQQLSRTTYLARSETASQQALDQAQNDVASAPLWSARRPRRRGWLAPRQRRHVRHRRSRRRDGSHSPAPADIFRARLRRAVAISAIRPAAPCERRPAPGSAARGRNRETR